MWQNQDGQIILEDSEIVMPLMNHMDDSDDEEEWVLGTDSSQKSKE